MMSDQLIYRQLLEFPTQRLRTIPLWITTGSLIIDIRGLNAGDVNDVAYLIQYQFRGGLGWVKNDTLKVSSSLSHIQFDGSYPYKLAVLPVRSIKQFELSIYVSSQYVSTSLDLYSGENRLSLKALNLMDSYSLIYPATKPQAGQVQRVIDAAGQTEWVQMVEQSDIDALSFALDGLTAAIESKAPTSHIHEIADIGTLSDVLNGKANSTDVTEALNSKADINHTHPASVVPWGVPGAIGATTPNSGKFTTLYVTSNANTISATTGAIWCAGGAYFARNVQIGAQLQVNDVFRHSGTTAGFFNTAPISKPSVSGSRVSGVALTNLLTALKSLGLISDTTTA